MTTTDRTDAARFRDTEYLRHLLLRITSTRDGWDTDPEAHPLLAYARDRFTDLARKHGLGPEDAMSVAFEAMRNPATRLAHDPWAVIVHAVATTFRAWQFADEALTSLDTARRGGLSGCRAERMCERDQSIPLDCDPAFTMIEPEPEPAGGRKNLERISVQAHKLADLLVAGGWPADSALLAVDVILRKLADAGSRPAAYEALRRDQCWRNAAGIPLDSWTGLLRLLLGSPAETTARGSVGQGILLRQAFGETVEDDPEVVATIALLNPRLAA